MAGTGTLRDAFVDELRDIYDAEKQLLKALAKLAKAAAAPALAEAFTSHGAETEGQIERLEQVFASIDQRVGGKICDAIAGIIDKGEAMAEAEFDEATMDACLIAAGQRAEHYELAAYGTLVAWANTLGLTEAISLLQQNLDEERAADQRLTQLAEGGLNAAANHAETDGDAEGKPTSRSKGAGKS